VVSTATKDQGGQNEQMGLRARSTVVVLGQGEQGFSLCRAGVRGVWHAVCGAHRRRGQALASEVAVGPQAVLDLARGLSGRSAA